MKFLDLSQPLFDEAPNCPAHPPVQIRTAGHSDGGATSWQMEFFDFASHSGSHLDAPRHKIRGGKTLDELPLETFAGDAILADLRGLKSSTPMDGKLLQGALEIDVRNKIVLLCTGWGERRAKTQEWLYQSPFLSSEGATFLVERGAKAVGIDHFSIGGAAEPGNANTHEILLGAGLWIIEELRFPDEIWELSQPLQFMALPLNLREGSGAPCRPVIILEN